MNATIQQSPPELRSPPLVSLVRPPRICLTRCTDCIAGKRTVSRKGVVTQYECPSCWGHSTVVSHA